MSAETPNPIEPTPQGPEQHAHELTPEAAKVVGHLAVLSQMLVEFEGQRLAVDKAKTEQWARLADPAHPLYEGASHADVGSVEYGVYTMPDAHHHHATRRERRRDRKLADAQREQNTQASTLAWLKHDEYFLGMVRRKVDLSPMDVLKEKAHVRAERRRGHISRADYKHEMGKLKDKSHKHQAYLDLPAGTVVEAPTPYIDKTEKRLKRANDRVVRLGGTAVTNGVIEIVTIKNGKEKVRRQPAVVPATKAA